MVGIKNGVYAKLKQEYPHLILMRCVCHSIQLAMSYASAECLPRNLEFVIAETHNWFAKSALRQSQYNQLHESINQGLHPLKIPSDSKTRWLSIQPAVDRIVSQWLELKTHFEIVRERKMLYCWSAVSNVLWRINLPILFFVRPLLTEVRRTNVLFESKNVDKMKLLDDLLMLFKTIFSKLVARLVKLMLLLAQTRTIWIPGPI